MQRWRSGLPGLCRRGHWHGDGPADAPHQRSPSQAEQERLLAPRGRLRQVLGVGGLVSTLAALTFGRTRLRGCCSVGCTPPFEAKSAQAEADGQPRSKLLLSKHHFFVAAIVQWFRVSRARAIPKGAWRLQLLSDRPLLPLDNSGGDREGVSDSSPGSEKRASAGDEGGEAGQEGSTTIVPCQERVVYGGVYVPNKYLLFFR